MKKKLLLLGGSRYLFPVIDAAHDLGVEVITADYLPNNIAHTRSDYYCNVSIIEKDAVLQCARNLGISGIMSFAADPGVTAAAYVAEQMGLPFQGSYDAVCTLQNKGRFRAFLRDNNFNCPEMHVFASVEEAVTAVDELAYPVIVKPTDSAGSKGCTRVNEPSQLKAAVKYALQFSLSNKCIVEQFLEKAHPSSDADCFTVNGRFECVSFSSQYFDESAPNPYAPAAFGMPAAMPKAAIQQFVADLQRLSNLLHLNNGVYNIETRVATDGKPYIMEVSPRGGGNRLCEMLRFATGGRTDLIRAAVQAALGMPVEGVEEPVYDGFWYQQVLHADCAGVFEGIEYAPGFVDAHVVDQQLWITKGSRVEGFAAANHAFGSVMLRFDTQEDLDEFHANKKEFMRVRVG